jgi:hypothetical protein
MPSPLRGGFVGGGWHGGFGGWHGGFGGGWRAAGWHGGGWGWRRGGWGAAGLGLGLAATAVGVGLYDDVYAGYPAYGGYSVGPYVGDCIAWKRIPGPWGWTWSRIWICD